MFHFALFVLHIHDALDDDDNDDNDDHEIFRFLIFDIYVQGYVVDSQGGTGQEAPVWLVNDSKTQAKL